MSRNLNVLTLAAILALPLPVDAQSRGRSQQGTRSPRAEAMAPPRQLAQTLLPAGARRVPPARFEAPRDGWNRWPQANRSWWKHQRFNPYPFGHLRQGYGSYYAVPFAGGSYIGAGAGDERHEAEAPPPPATNKGVLRLEVTPGTGLDYYVDGVYIGSSSSLGTEFEINAGARQIEIRSRGYKTIAIDLRIDEGRVTTWRGVLEPVAQPQAPAAAGSRVMYVIPGCYIGNARPAAGSLPAGCDVRKMVTRGSGL
jgi:hypothetical protein